MKNTLKKLKLLDTFRLELDGNRDQFITNLDAIVDNGSLDMFSDMFDVFSSSKNEYKGSVQYDEFKIKRRRRFFDINIGFALVTGKCSQEGGKLIIDLEINGFHGHMMVLLILILIMYGIAVSAFLAMTFFNDDVPVFVLPFIILHGLFMFGLPYMFARRSVKRMRYDIERELVYLSRK